MLMYSHRNSNIFFCISTIFLCDSNFKHNEINSKNCCYFQWDIITMKPFFVMTVFFIFSVIFRCRWILRSASCHRRFRAPRVAMVAHLYCYPSCHIYYILFCKCKVFLNKQRCSRLKYTSTCVYSRALKLMRCGVII